jgi:hypothetical protein
VAVKSNSYTREDYLMVIFDSPSLGRKVKGQLQRKEIVFIIVQVKQENLALQRKGRGDKSYYKFDPPSIIGIPRVDNYS